MTSFEDLDIHVHDESCPIPEALHRYPTIGVAWVRPWLLPPSEPPVPQYPRSALCCGPQFSEGELSWAAWEPQWLRTMKTVSTQSD